MTCPCKQSPQDPRRGFLAQAGAAMLGLVTLGVPSLAGLAAFLNPWRQKNEAGAKCPIPASMIATQPIGGPPMKFVVVTERTNAWNREQSEKIVFLRRTSEKEVVALSSICPHAGCGVSYDAKEGCYFCPCHAARFDLDGKRLDANSMSPRDLDSLKVTACDSGGFEIQYEEFKPGTSEKVTKS